MSERHFLFKFFQVGLFEALNQSRWYETPNEVFNRFDLLPRISNAKNKPFFFQLFEKYFFSEEKLSPLLITGPLGIQAIFKKFNKILSSNLTRKMGDPF